MMGKCRLLFSGSGGQGVITAAILMAEAAVLYESLNAVQTQSYGAEARGGATRAGVIIWDQPIYFPKVNKPNILVCLTQTAYNKFQPTIRPGGLLITDEHYVETSRTVDARRVELPLYDAVMDGIGQAIVYNICMLGAVVALTDLVRPESVRSVIRSRFPESVLDLNTRALDIGIALVQDQTRPA